VTSDKLKHDNSLAYAGGRDALIKAMAKVMSQPSLAQLFINRPISVSPIRLTQKCFETPAYAFRDFALFDRLKM